MSGKALLRMISQEEDKMLRNPSLSPMHEISPALRIHGLVYSRDPSISAAGSRLNIPPASSPSLNAVGRRS
jgi:hypothetical protein